jgi:hypothetical protein
MSIAAEAGGADASKRREQTTLLRLIIDELLLVSHGSGIEQGPQCAEVSARHPLTKGDDLHRTAGPSLR